MRHRHRRRSRDFFCVRESGDFPRRRLAHAPYRDRDADELALARAQPRRRARRRGRERAHHPPQPRALARQDGQGLPRAAGAARGTGERGVDDARPAPARPARFRQSHARVRGADPRRLARGHHRPQAAGRRAAPRRAAAPAVLFRNRRGLKNMLPNAERACAWGVAIVGLGFAAQAGVQGFAALVTPPRFELAAKPGEKLRQVIEITNATAQPAKYRLKTADWTLYPNASISFDESLKPGSCRPWVAIES